MNPWLDGMNPWLDETFGDIGDIAYILHRNPEVLKHDHDFLSIAS